MGPPPIGSCRSTGPHTWIAGRRTGQRPILALARRCGIRQSALSVIPGSIAAGRGRKATEWNEAAATLAPRSDEDCRAADAPYRNTIAIAPFTAPHREHAYATHMLGASRSESVSRDGRPHPCSEHPRRLPRLLLLLRPALAISIATQARNFNAAVVEPSSHPDASGADGLEAGACCRTHQHERIGRAPDPPRRPLLPCCTNRRERTARSLVRCDTTSNRVNGMRPCARKRSTRWTAFVPAIVPLDKTAFVVRP